MRYNPNIHNRKSIRISNYDYSKEGMYFITICTQNRECILSEIVGAGPVSAQKNKNNLALKLTQLGIMINQTYLNLEEEYNTIKLHNYIIMPNHIHAIIEICNRTDTGPAPTLADIICAYKTRTTYLCARGVKLGIYKPFNKRLWQRNYYEHVIRNEKELYKINEYIMNNPYNWKNDENYIQ